MLKAADVDPCRRTAQTTVHLDNPTGQEVAGFSDGPRTFGPLWAQSQTNRIPFWSVGAPPSLEPILGIGMLTGGTGLLIHGQISLLQLL